MKSIRSSSIILVALCALASFAHASEPAAKSPQAGELPAMVTLSSGVRYAVIKPGTGAAIRAGDTVAFHQTSYPPGTTAPANWNRGEPWAGALGSGYVGPKELEEAIGLLRVGDRALVTIPRIPDYVFELEMVEAKALNLARVLQAVIDGSGLDAARVRYAELKAAQFPDCYVGGNLASLGARYLASHPQDRLAEALTVLQWTVELLPAYAEGHAQLARAQALAGNREEAVRSLEKAVELDAAKADWQAALAELKAGPESIERIRVSDRIAKELTAMAATKVESASVRAVGAKLVAYLAQYPKAADGARKVALYLDLAEAADVTQVEADARQFLASPNLDARKPAEAMLQRISQLKKPVDLKFTAVDGREVDLTKLRGKVVLIDFWATWCGPCIAELPNVKKVYADYHDKGFEIIGVALEFAQLKDGDTPEQAVAKLAKAKKVLMDFVAKDGMPWPQYFDGKGFANDIAARYQVQSIPAMFLFDRDGRLVSTNARGEKLEPEVKRLLGL